MLVAAAAQPQPAPDEGPVILLTPDAAYVVGPPSPTIRVSLAQWHPSKPSLLALQRSVPVLRGADQVDPSKQASSQSQATNRLLVLDAPTGNTRLLSTFAIGAVPASVAWISGGNGIMVLEEDAAGIRSATYRVIHAGSGQQMSFPTGPNTDPPFEHPRGIYFRNEMGLRFVDLTGPRMTEIQLNLRPELAARLAQPVMTDAKGRILESLGGNDRSFRVTDIFTGKSEVVPMEKVDWDDPTANKKLTLTSYEMDAVQLSYTPVDFVMTAEGPEPAPARPAIKGMMPLTDPWAKEVYRNPVVLAKGGKAIGVSADEQFLAYRLQGVLFLRTIATLDARLGLTRRIEEEVQKAVQSAKQAGLGALIYAADYDDVLPLNGDPERLMPYLKDRSILDRMVWTNLTGQNVAKITDPANTMLGYAPGPGGRAVLFADGSVRWVPDKKG